MAMKTSVILALIFGGMLVAAPSDEDVLTDPQLHVVRVKVLENRNVGGSFHVAIAEVDEVLKGSGELLGRRLEIPNSDRLFLGSRITYVSQPLLKAGQIGLTIVTRGDQGGAFQRGGLGPGGLLFPLIEGVHPEYDVMLQWLRERRDHPERLTPMPVAAKQQAPQIQAPPVPEVPVIQPPSVEPPKAAQPAAKDDHGIAEDGGAWWWMVGGLVALGALVLGWLRRHPAKRVGT